MIRDATNVVTRTLDRDLKVKKRVTPYSDKAFHRAAIEWLVATDQVRCMSLPSNIAKGSCSQYELLNIRNSGK